MRMPIDIPDKDLADAVRFTRAKSPNEAIIAAIADFHRRNRMANFTKHAGTCDSPFSTVGLQAQRRQD